MMDNDPKATCADVEGLLPLFVGGDLEGEDLALVATHVAGCGRCSAGLEAARAARRELRAGLRAGVLDREPELWPAIRADLARSGLLGSPGVAAPGTGVQHGDDVDRRPRRLVSLPRVAAGIAAGFAIFLVGQGLLGPTDTPVRPDAGTGSEIVEERGPGSGEARGVIDLNGGAALAGGEPVAPVAAPTGLRPVGFSTETLFDQAREDLLREGLEQRTLRSGAGFFPIAPDGGAGAQGDLASGYRLQ